ncbi:MAG: hypothetical protein Kow0081_3250 [Candidatus Dojkabacteria bacterium]
MKKLFVKTIFALLVISLFIHASAINNSGVFSTHAQSSKEIQEEIERKKQELEQKKKEIQDIEKEIEESKIAQSEAKNGLPLLQEQIQEVELKLQRNIAELDLLKQEYELSKIQQASLVSKQKRAMKSIYKEWAVKKSSVFDLSNPSDAIRITRFSSEVIGATTADIDNVSKLISEHEQVIGSYEEKLKLLEEENFNLALRKQQIENEIAYYQNIIARGGASINDLQFQMSSIEGQIADLLVEQQEAARREAEIISSPPPPPKVEAPPVVTEGGFFFSGRGRDLYQGHGVGMSQWGAYGAAEQGWSAEQILTFYYTNVRIEQRPGTINVQGYGVMDINDYVAGLGEVPSKACGNAEQAAERPDKYVIDNPDTVWDCWPEEAIKAQVIAARSYGLRASQPICTTAACQVYAGHKDKKWAADETKDMVIVSNGSTHNNQIISALYSSDNSQGGGTANNDTIFQNFYGDGTPYSYLRVVNDTSFARTTQWTYWEYVSAGYDYKILFEALNFVANNPASTATVSVKTNLSQFLQGVSSFTGIDLERDSSGRVKKVWFTTQTGERKSIGGWWFKSIWNSWQYDIGRGDYLYSQTFFVNFQ